MTDLVIFVQGRVSRPYDWDKVGLGKWRIFRVRRINGEEALSTLTLYGAHQCASCGLPVQVGRFCHVCSNAYARYKMDEVGNVWIRHFEWFQKQEKQGDGHSTLPLH